jgi:hypothetical protein
VQPEDDKREPEPAEPLPGLFGLVAAQNLVTPRSLAEALLLLAEPASYEIH